MTLIVSGVAFVPRIVMAGSPGTASSSSDVTSVTITSTGMTRSRRWRMKRPMRLVHRQARPPGPPHRRGSGAGAVAGDTGPDISKPTGPSEPDLVEHHAAGVERLIAGQPL